MTRALLLGGLLVGTLVLGLLTAILQSHNRGEGARLDALREECLLLEAVQGAQRSAIVELDHGPLPAPASGVDSKSAVQRARGAQ
ncbi:MAG: hypothetical protein JNK02_05650 [Planctomycetes bacterium]|nr:hypothetical protein [Planctomycetota bacterium]